MWLDEAKVRVETAETELASLEDERRSLLAQVASLQEEAFTTAPPSFDELGHRVGRVLQEAWAAAAEMRQEAEKDAAAIASRTKEEALAEVATMVEEAKRQSAELVAESRAEADRLTGEAERRRRELSSEIAVLTDRRDSALAELARLRSGLEALFSVASGEATSRGTIDLRTVDEVGTADNEGAALTESANEAAS